MASEVDIVNLALAHLGDTATVSSINPPEGSAQAEHAQRFYPVARDALLQLHNWNFAMRRAALPMVTSEWPEWQYAYSLPADMMTAVSLLAHDASEDYTHGGEIPFTIELNSSHQKVLLTNEMNAVLRYTAYVTDTTTFNPLFITALSWNLAGFLAGPLLKGDVGAAEAKRCQTMVEYFIGKAMATDSNMRKISPHHSVGWITGR